MAEERSRGGRGLSSIFCEALGDPDSELYTTDAACATRRIGFAGYFLTSFGISLALSFIAIGLWSEVGCGMYCLEAMRENERYASVSGAICLAIVLTLYVFDFFCPPHLPKQHLTLWHGDRVVGRAALVLAAGFFVAFCFLMAGDFPVVPLIVTVFLSPLAILTFRWCVAPQDSAAPESSRDGADSPESSSSCDSNGGAEMRYLSWKSFRCSVETLRRITGDQREQKAFYLAAAFAFTCTGVACLVTFFIWASNVDFRPPKGIHQRDQEMVYILVAAPVGIAVSNFLFAMLMGLRVALHRVYASSDDLRSKLVVETANRAMCQDTLQRQITALVMATKRSAVLNEEPSTWPQHCREELDVKIAECLRRQYVSTQRLTNLIKILNATFLVILGALFVTFQFTQTDSHFAMLAQGFVAAMMATFIVYTMMAFTRIWRKLKVWLHDLPLWNSVCALATKDWARGSVVLFAFPLLPCLLVLSAVNERVRRLRGIQLDDVRQLGDAGPPRSILTSRVSKAMKSLSKWNWLSVIFWAYVWSYALLLYKLTPISLNILLAWMSSAMAGMHFAVILLLTFASGMVLFMLPPVPGPPIYLFGGFVISDKCPWGFVWGTVICILLCFVLKLTACAVQQKLIGGYLSTKVWVRRACGVHTPLMRAIERVLRRPGLSFGKVMILCGGPDWPTSVLAGILGISVFQCELGTCPIIASVVPLCLSGSFYLRRVGYGEVWPRLGNFMFILTGAVSVAFWAGMAWAIQDEFDRSYAAITAAREEFVDLEWLDHRASEIGRRCGVSWQDVPRSVLAAYSAGVIGIAAAGHLFFWRSGRCFGMFAVGDDINSVRWFGEDSLIRPLGMFGLALAATSSGGLVVYRAWLAHHTKAPAAAASRVLDAQESEWKASRRREAQLAAREQPPSPARVGPLQADHFADMLDVEPSQPKEPCAPTHSGHCFMGALDAVEGFEQDLARSPRSPASDAVPTPHGGRGGGLISCSPAVMCSLPNGICDDDWGSSDADLLSRTLRSPATWVCGLGGSTSKTTTPSTFSGGRSFSAGPTTLTSWSAGGDDIRADSSSGSPTCAKRLGPFDEDEPDLT